MNIYEVLCPVNESFDGIPNKYAIDSNTMTFVRYTFEYDSKEYAVTFQSFTHGNDKWSLAYGIYNRQTASTSYIPMRSNIPNATHVLTTVIAIGQDFVYKHPDITELIIDGDKGQGLDRLYNLLVPRLARKLGFDYDIDDADGVTSYIIHLN